MKRFALLLIFIISFSTNAYAESFRIATYNLNWGNRRGDQVLDAIANAKPDLICFQETTVQSEGFLRGRLSGTHPYFYSAGHEGRYAAERFAFASKVRLSDIAYTAPKGGLFGFYAVEAVVGGKSVHVLNVHLTPFHLDRGSGIAEAMALAEKTEKQHAAEIASISEAVDPDKPTIIVGDFNSISSFVAPVRLMDAGFVDSYASLHADADTHATWTWPTRPLPLALRIDYIFHSKHFSTVDSSIIRREGSDHFLLVTEVEFRDP